MKMRDRIVVAAAAAVTVVIGGLTIRNRPPVTGSARAISPVVPLPEGQRLQDDWAPEEVFRRAFWRHPQCDDRIVNAVRYERSDDSGVNRWAWFIQLHPGPRLLRDLRAQETFGLAAADSPRPWLAEDLPPPAWYSARTGDPDVQVFQHPSQNLTLIYRAAGNHLLASDHGGGFARPAAE